MASRLSKASIGPHDLIRSVTFLLFALALVVIFFLHQPQSDKEISQGKTAQTTENVEHEKSFWQRFSSDPIYILTSGPLVVGVAQAGLFFWQLSLIRVSVADTKKAAKAAKRQAKLARDSLIASQRAWIDFDVSLIENLVADHSGFSICVEFSGKNVGNAPAVNVDCIHKFYLHNFGVLDTTSDPPKIIEACTNSASDLRELCETRAHIGDLAAGSKLLVGWPLFPNKTFVQRCFLNITFSDIKKIIEARSADAISPLLIVGVIYRLGTDTKTNYTGYVYRLFMKDASSPGGARAIPPLAGTIPAQQILLIKEPFSSGIVT